MIIRELIDALQRHNEMTRRHIALLKDKDRIIGELHACLSAANDLTKKFATAVGATAFIAGFCVGLAVGVA